MKRFQEHMKLAMKGSSDRLFPKLLSQATGARNFFLRSGSFEESIICQQLTGSYHVVCAAGRTADNASEIEDYLIRRRSLSFGLGLNMIGGKGRSH